MDSELDAVRRINKLAGQARPVDLMMDLITRYGHWAFLIYGILLWFAPGKNQKHRRESCVAAFLAVCLCSVISLAVGKLWHRGRPFTRDRQIWNFTGHKANASFPSNHAMNSAAVAFQLLRDRMPGCRWMACLAGLLAFSRLFVTIFSSISHNTGKTGQHTVRCPKSYSSDDVSSLANTHMTSSTEWVSGKIVIRNRSPSFLT